MEYLKVKPDAEAAIEMQDDKAISDDETEVEDESMLPQDRSFQRVKSIWHRNVSYTIHGGIMLLNLTLLVALLSQTRQSLPERQKACGSVLERWLPGFEDGVEYETQRFVGTFGARSAFTGYGPEVDQAWWNITLGVDSDIGISKEEWEANNEHGESPVMVDNPPAGNSGPYLATFDVFHQLRCLDILRKNIHREYYGDIALVFEGFGSEIIEKNLEHCVEMLRQTLMCNGDLTPVTYNWVGDRSFPYPNFNTLHTCKNWDKLVEWSRARQYKRADYGEPEKPEGVVGLWPPP